MVIGRNKSLLLHCSYIVVPLLFHCFYTVVTLFPDYCYTVGALLLHCWYTVVALLSHCCLLHSYTVVGVGRRVSHRVYSRPRRAHESGNHRTVSEGSLDAGSQRSLFSLYVCVCVYSSVCIYVCVCVCELVLSSFLPYFLALLFFPSRFLAL
jgi:small-conductance mechanosensitive channel